jgi:iron complex transport system substrate-binding protein
LKSLLIITMAMICLAGGPALAAPQRVVSLNPCLDVILVNVADRAQIAALSHFSSDPDTSTIADAARAFPVSYETAEEVISFQPDLVLTSRHSSLATRNALSRVGIKLELFGEPQSVAESIAQVRHVAALVEQVARGEELVARIEAALRDAAPPPAARPVSALIFQSNGFSTGGETLVNEMLARTGFVNAARDYGLEGWGVIPLERVIADPPQMLLAGEFRSHIPTWADRVVRHPALRKVEGRMKRATFPDRLLYCGGPVLIQAARTLANARDKVQADAP